MENNVPKLVLLDSSAIIHRAYHGLPPLTTHDGILVNAVYGYITTYFKVIEEFKPKYIVATFDEKGPTVRHHEFKEYKAHRPAPPDDLIKQFQYVKDVCKVLNVPVISLRGYEADDVIGTITHQVKNRKLKVKSLIVTGDMDTLQLIDDNVFVYSMSRGIKKAEIYNAEKVKEKYGFLPNQMIDYKALRGDPSDNIPGVPGIGEKTATTLIQNFGSLNNLYEQVESGKLKVKSSELLVKYKDQAFLSKKLATIIKDVPIEFNLSDCLVHDYDKKKAEALFKKLEFKSLIARLPKEEKNNKQTSLF